MATQNGSTISSVTVASNNMTIIWTNSPNEYTFVTHYISLLSSRSQYSGTGLPTAVAPGTSSPYKVPVTLQYLNPPAQLNGFSFGSYYTDSSTSYTIGDLPPGTYYVLLMTYYGAYKAVDGSRIPENYVGTLWPNPVTVTKINTAVSIPDLISVSTDNYSFIKFTNKASLYNGTYPATTYTYYAFNQQVGIRKTVTVQPNLDTYGNQYFAWTISKRIDDGLDNSILNLGGPWTFSFAASYTSPSTGTVNSGLSDPTQVYNLVDKVPETPLNLQVVQTDLITRNFQSVRRFGPGTSDVVSDESTLSGIIKLTWDHDLNRYGDPAVQYLISLEYSYRQYQVTNFSVNNIQNYYFTVDATPNVDNSFTWNPFDFFGGVTLNPGGRYVNGQWIYNSFISSWGELTPDLTYNFSVQSKDSKGNLSSPASVSINILGNIRPKTIQSVSVYKCNPKGSYAIPITLVPNQNSSYVTPTYFTVYWSSTNPPTSIGQQYIADKQYYAGFGNQGAVYDTTGQGYISSSVVYLNGGFPTNTSELYFGVNSVYSYKDSNGTLQYIYNPTIVWTQNVKNL